MKHLYLALLICFLLQLPSLIYGQVSSNAGTEFWITFPTHVPDFDKQFKTSYANLSIFLTGRSPSSGIVSAGAFKERFTITPGSVTQIDVPRIAAYINDYESGQVLPNRAIHIVVDPGNAKIVAYAHIYAGQRSEATLVLPKEALGQQYYSINYRQYEQEGKNYITLVASEPQTKIRIKRGNTELVPGGVTLNNVNDVYEYLSEDDLTGVSVSVDSLTSGCKHFAMFSGSSGIYIPSPGCTPTSIDPLLQQCYPLDSWGTSYAFIPFSMQSPGFTTKVRTAGQFIRVLAMSSGTKVAISGKPVALLNRGEFYTSPQPLNNPALITASAPVCVAQYAISQACSDDPLIANIDSTGYSDPDMVILNPISFSIKDITLYSSVKQNITEQYVNIFIRTTAASGLRVNGKSPSGNFSPFPALNSYSYIQLLLKDSTNTFHITAPAGFNAIAYGFGNVESYSYSAGTDLAATGVVNAVDLSSGKAIDSACINSDYRFVLSLPYIAPQLTWQMDAQELPVVQHNPVYQVVKTDGQIAYQYAFPKTAAYQNTGIHQIRVIAVYAQTIGGCNNGQQDILSSFKVIPAPVAKFTYAMSGCINKIVFSNISIDPEHQIMGYLWNFGDKAGSPGNGSSLNSPAHTYADSGRYIVKLTVFSASGCQGTISDTLHLSGQVLPAFMVLNTACAGKPLIFTDTSKTTGFRVARRIWNFGDGDSTISTSPGVTHTYITAGLYHCRLTLLSDQGCLSDAITKIIAIGHTPNAGFTVPPVCLTDEYAYFNAVVNGSSSTAKGYSYFWNFGDDQSDAGNPNVSTLQSPHHHFSEPKPYIVSLTVSTQEGCDTVITQILNVNKGSPISAFDVPAPNHSCSGSTLIFTDKSVFNGIGTINRLVWYFDVKNHPSEKMVIDSLHPDKLYTHTYPSFYNPQGTITYFVKLVVYSGTSCVDSVTKSVTIYPLPRVTLDSIPPVCIAAAPFLLSQGKETSGLTTGTGFYSGAGIFNNTLNPQSAGIGDHLITYTYVTANGCAESTARHLNVLPEPVITIPPVLSVIYGHSITLDPVYSGTNLTFSWSPEAGLDRTDIPNPVANPVNDTRYTVTVSNGICSASATIKLIVLKQLIADNTFTPNGDGINDLWIIPDIQLYPLATVDVFTRYGMSVFHSLGYSKPWDGRYNGKELPTGTYYYVINPNNGLRVTSGYVVILR